ncbi:hypothetical protein AB0N62_41160 [Streptomyces sp. NPDC093982]|uniref:hypothetical protein n=1 Tax=Streptomyces sp. NPDC093982 TaxID=3155077 RepID=UPI003442DCEF
MDVIAERLNRLYVLVGQRRIRRTVAHTLWIYDRPLVIVETISEKLRLTGEEDITLYERAWDWLSETTEFGAPARRPSLVLSIGHSWETAPRTCPIGMGRQHARPDHYRRAAG